VSKSKDDNSSYLTAPGAKMLRVEREHLRDVAGKVPPKTVMVNIGVLWGCSVRCLRAGNATAPLRAIDVDVSVAQGLDELAVTLVQGDSRELWKEFSEPIGLLFIDGDHHYETVKRDIAGWVPLVVPGGRVLFHDYAPEQVDLDLFPHIHGVRQAVDEYFNGREDWRAVEAPGSLREFERCPTQ